MNLEAPQIEYPYLPEGRVLKYVAHDHPMMIEARKAQEEFSGDPSYPVGSVLVKDGKIIASAGNGFNRGRQVHICPRLVLDVPTGTQYELCSLHLNQGHSEQMCVDQACEAGADTEGADLYMYGHWWACEPCWKKLLDAGIRDVYVTDDAHIRFARDKVYSAFLTPSSKSVYIAGTISSLPQKDRYEYLRLYERFDETAREMGLESFVPHIHSDIEKSEGQDVKSVFDVGEGEIAKRDAFVAEVTHPSHGVGMELMSAYKLGKSIILLSKKGSDVGRFVKSIPTVVYHAEYEDFDEACKFLKNILKQL
ncbi:hypothetical protein HN358_02425 [Candidatus Uhrbacteria bacterium]|jgi:2'-deoxynucleoside 5'-phosphate N-hydrolase|nr:hypothetical protein [Candidatus Uhrbacteria bacterium]MBT7717535.1 hypothetical protein [Candidatus Uhrbacteria bacterium]